MARRAVLIFAEKAHIDRARRSFPVAVRPLLNLLAFASEIRGDETDVHLFDRQTGRGFAARFENAIEAMARLGYEEVVAVGRDCPSLSAQDIEQAFAELASKRLVLGPDHRGGCYLIGFRTADRELLRGVRWKRNTDCAELLRRGGASDVLLLPIKHDLDSWADLRLFALINEALAHLAAFVLSLTCLIHAALVEFVSVVAQRMRIRQQMPPPAAAA